MADLGAEFNLATQLADKLKFVNSLLEQKGTLDDEALKRAKELVSTVGKLKGEYNTTKDIQNDAAKVADKLATTQNTISAISQNLTRSDRQRVQFILNQEKGLQSSRDQLAQLRKDEEAGIQGAGDAADALAAQIRGREKALVTQTQNLSAEEKQLVILKQQQQQIMII